MGSGDNAAHFFLGALASQGFISRYTQFYSIDDDGYIYILKGGPGAGKAYFIEKLTAALRFHDENIELIHSLYDPDSYDGAIFHTLKAAIVDGSSPHVLEPRYYDAFETILPLGDFCNKELIRSRRSEILSLTDKHTQLSERCVRFISAAGSLLNDTYRLSLNCTDEDKISAFVSRILLREIKATKKHTGKEQFRFLSAVTSKGIVVFDKTISHYCDKVYIINDDFSAASSIIMQKLRKGILENGYDIISCYCPISPFEKLEHIIIPELHMGFVTSNKWHTLEFEKARTIHARRFTSLEKLSVRKQRISFNRRAAGELVDEAIGIMSQSKAICDELEKIYLDAVDFEKMDEFIKLTADNILSMSER